MGVPAGDTWGISGPKFLLLYLAAAALAIGATLILRWFARRGRRPGRELSAYETAQLAGGAAWTISAVLAGLHVDGAIKISEGRMLSIDPAYAAVLGADRRLARRSARLLGRRARAYGGNQAVAFGIGGYSVYSSAGHGGTGGTGYGGGCGGGNSGCGGGGGGGCGG
jgi:hypothetical protein